METRADSTTAAWWRRGWSVLDRLMAEVIWLHPTTAAFFRVVAVEEGAEEVLEEVVSAPLAA